jgi:hypothetical protein
MNKAEEIAGILLPAKANEADKKKPPREREEGGGDQTPHEVKQYYS